ncbi:MAG: hypothetical protein V3T23_02165 [Nitrososphaerales archaeon]
MIDLVSRGLTISELERITEKLRKDEVEIVSLKSRLDFWRRRAATRQNRINQLIKEVSNEFRRQAE